MATCIIRGTGDVGSAVAHLLFLSGHQVLLHDDPAPGHIRRGMAFTDALFGETAQLDTVIGKPTRDLDDVAPMVKCGRAIPVTCAHLDNVIRQSRANVVIDARMRKHAMPENARSADYLSIGLGPNFKAGGNVDIAVETAWGESLGKVIQEGSTLPLAGEPKPIDGVGRERNVYATRSGVLRTSRRIGAFVQAGEIVAVLDEHFVTAPITGCIRGLTHHGVKVQQGAKILEIDPRQEPSGCFGLGERPRRIANGVLEAVMRSPQ